MGDLLGYTLCRRHGGDRQGVSLGACPGLEVHRTRPANSGAPHLPSPLPPSPPCAAQFKGIDQEFDGGDSGGGVVGDGNTDLEDQHNSATLGALRGGVADFTAATLDVGRGNVRTLDDVDYSTLNEGEGRVEQATNARTSAAGANYFGRSTGMADKLKDKMTDDDLKTGRMDCVRAQQKENWFNQRAIHKSNRAQGQGVVFGDTTEGGPSSGGYIARDAQSSQSSRTGAPDGEISQKELASHMADLASKPAERLDGQTWDDLAVSASDTFEQVFEVRASQRQTHVETIMVKNDLNTFAPFQCGFAPGGSTAYSVTPDAGTMNRRSGEPVEVVVRYKPMETGNTHEAELIFETEDMRKVFKFIGST